MVYICINSFSSSGYWKLYLETCYHGPRAGGALLLPEARRLAQPLQIPTFITMDIKDAIALIKHTPANAGAPSVWADLGCGAGTFTYALAHLLETGSTIYAFDKERPRLTALPNPQQVYIKPGQLDFLEDDLPVTGLNGILMANSLHYVPGKPAFIDKISRYLQPDGVFLIVEYETLKTNPWVPYPVPFQALKALFHDAGFTSAGRLNERPSLYGSGHMYAALFRR